MVTAVSIHPQSLAIRFHLLVSDSYYARRSNLPVPLPLCLTFNPSPRFPIFLSRFAFFRLPFHNNEISDQWRWIKSVLFTPLDDDGKESVCFRGMPFWGLSTACPVAQKSVPLEQGSPTLLLESYHPADFSSNPNQTHLNQLIKVFRSTW